MKVTMNLDITAADVAQRTLTGRILPFNEIGTPNIGRTKFLPGSVNFGEPNKVKLNLEHDRSKPVGKATQIWQEGDNLMASFKIANTTAGSDVLVEAVEGLRDGFSVEIAAADFTVEDGVTVISKGDLMGVAVVTNPAFASAAITEIAATEEQTTEPSTDGAEAPQQEEPMDEVRPEAEATPVVEASAPAPQVGLAFTSPRSPIVDGASYLEHSIKAATGNHESALYVRAADDTTSTNTGLTIPGAGAALIRTNFEGRPAINAVSQEALVDSGMSFIIPTLGTKPTVAETAEGAAPSETGMTSSYQTVTVKKASGLNRVSFELLDRSTPSFYNELLRQMQYAYAKFTDEALIAALTASGTQAAAVAADAAGLQSFIATESAAAYKGSGEFASNLVASPDFWAFVMGLKDSSNRPLYFANNPSNNPGAVNGNSAIGNVLDKAFSVDPFIATSGVVDESAFLIAPGAITWYESPQTQLRVNVLTSGKVELDLYAYYAIAVKKASGIRRFNLV